MTIFALTQAKDTYVLLKHLSAFQIILSIDIKVIHEQRKPSEVKQSRTTSSIKQIMMRYKEEKEAKKEAFRKYLESSGVLDALTKVLVALYEQNDKPSSALEFIQQSLGGPSSSEYEYEKLQSELSDLQAKYNDLLAVHQETCKELEELKNLHNVASTTETTDGEAPKDEP